MGDLSPHFSTHELRCRCGECELVLPPTVAVRALEELRGVLGVPIYITSCARCPTHNSREGGTEGSRHLTFWGTEFRKPDAFDIVVPALSLRKLFRAARTVKPFDWGGIGVYPWWPGLHLDVRGTKARWFQESKGAAMKGIPGSYYL